MHLSAFEGVDQFDGGGEADTALVDAHGIDADGGGEVGFAGARSADQDDVVVRVEEGGGVQAFDHGLIDAAAGEVEACEIAMVRAAGSLHLVGHAAECAIGAAGAEEQPRHCLGAAFRPMIAVMHVAALGASGLSVPTFVRQVSSPAARPLNVEP